ncbi:MAG: radical SAM protein [Gaiellales bacterium]|nr:MAG: radical SAM protein [Gaiellales bacterium]
MRILLINPPYRSKIVRRYVCSYNAPNFLFPPLELMYLSAQGKAAGGEVLLLDAIAEGLTAEEALRRAREFRPDIAVTIMAIEYFDNDVGFLGALKREVPGALAGSFGYLPSNFTAETIEASGSDFVLVGEPDLALGELVRRVAAGEERPDIAGIAWRREDGSIGTAEYQRIESLDGLPYADQSAIDHSLYGEPFFGHPYTTFQSARGCPFPCVYCVRTFGRKLALASAEHVVGEVTDAVERFGIRYFRFMDDTFTVSRKRVFEICDGLSALGRDINWSCLTRPNTIDGEVAEALRAAGCRRVYVGIESGSQKVVDYLKRGYDLENIMGNLEEVRRSGLEMVGWFIVGAPAESREDFEASLALARRLKLEFIAVSTLAPYPETELFELERDNIDFSLLPYRCSFTHVDDGNREAEFYRRYYLRPGYIIGKAGKLARHPGELARSGREFIRYAIASRRDPNRKDLL